MAELNTGDGSELWIASKDDVEKYVSSYKEAKKELEEMNSSIVLGDFSKNRVSRIIAIKHCDGSYLEFHSACCRKYSEDFFFVFTEHHGNYMYHKDDIECICEWFNDYGKKSREKTRLLYKQCYSEVIKNEGGYKK